MNTKEYLSIREELQAQQVALVAVSKTKPVEAIQEAYQLGQRIFGENRALELRDKYEVLPKDIEWHMIGHLQTNKVKYIAPFVHLIHSIDKISLLKEVNKRAAQNNRVIDVLIQVHIAEEASKHGFDETELFQLLQETNLETLPNINIIGLMGMATFTSDQDQVKQEFQHLQRLFEQVKTTAFEAKEDFNVLSMGMSGDYLTAIQQGSNMVRLGSIIFGAR
ncbi:MAG: YggS family pyridoxal phosphate-dependent enzyme [Saprospiraceae bacterium]|nr:YggS family pyridoxal phosphate-dependent enzyme [Saprospiraceae bacterium]